ncbi:MAG: hypothetical protein IIT36_02510, partial [Aeriscardovia sp.]|nr:hypothetical protein [Aeriscardovia sp.]
MSVKADWLLGLGWMILTQLLAWQADTMSETALILLASLMGITILAGWAYPMRFEEWETKEKTRNGQKNRTRQRKPRPRDRHGQARSRRP